MTKNSKFRLCGGTFFTLLSDARLPMPSKSQFYEGKRSGITEPELLRALAKIVQPDIRRWFNSEEKTIKDNTRDFKACINWGGGFFRFNDSSVRKSFDNRIRTDYRSALDEMCNLVTRFIDYNSSTQKDEYLVKAIIEVLDGDKTIDVDQEFFICPDGSSMKKSDLLKDNNFILQPFLLGIWHFVITALDDNTIGAETYNSWCPPQNGGRRYYTAAIGENSNRNIGLTYIGLKGQEPVSFVMPPYREQEEVYEQEEELEDPEVEVLEESEPTKEQVNQTVNNPFVFNFTQNGNNNTQIGHVEHYHKGDKE